jgi:hydroxyacylglutathione hydrolase
VFVEQFVVEGLGHISTLIADDTAGVAAVVDPRRDVDVYLAAARRRELRITHVFETHLHNDYVSGGRELAAEADALHVIGARASLGTAHRAVRQGETIEVGALRFVALETPGHTPEHVSYAVADTERADEPVLLFTGGSLLVGSVGRTDLLGADNAIPYAHAMFDSLHDVILREEDFVGVYPTHGAGSLCSTGIASTLTSTIGFERRHNPMLRPADVDAFASRLLGRQPAVPRYFARMRPLNQAGPALLGGVPEPQPLPYRAVRELVDHDALIVDVRQPAGHVAGYIPGSVSIPAGSSFGTWLGWVVDPDRPLILLLDRASDWDDTIRQVLRIGYEGSVRGFLRGGFVTWAEAGGKVVRALSMTTDELAARIAGDDAPPLVIDVRQASEYAAGHVPGSVHIDGGRLPDVLDTMPVDRPIAAICERGYRSSVAASLLRRAGFTNIVTVSGGVATWKAAGHPTDLGPGDEGPVAMPVAAGHSH